jgi:hypothetical protein
MPHGLEPAIDKAAVRNSGSASGASRSTLPAFSLASHIVHVERISPSTPPARL